MKRKIVTFVILSGLLLLTVVALMCTNEKSSNWGQRKIVFFKELEQNFEQPDMIYAPFAFWFWDTPLDAELAAQMAEEMCRQRMNPGYAHPRRGLPREQWLSPLWFKSVDAALEKAEAANAYLGYCDEYWWPSGRADGRVLKAHPELAAVSLKWKINDIEEGTTVELPESFFTVAAQYENTPAGIKIKSSTLQVIGSGPAFTWQAPMYKWRVYSFTKYHHSGLDGGDVNYIDRRLPKAFIDIAHESFANYFGKRMGKSIPGVFVDNEGDFGYRLAWSDDLDQEYKESKGRDIRLWMPLMFNIDIEGMWAKARWDWYDMVSDIYTDNYLGSVSRWLEARGMYDISNLWEESIVSQAFAVGDLFKAQRAVTMPGTDCLRSRALHVHDFKETQSMTEFESKRFQSEILGVAGWQMTPVLMKKAVNSVTAWGVSHIVPHGVYLNRKLNTIPYPPDWFINNPYWRYFHLWTDFTRRASYINSHGHIIPDVLLLNPMDSIWALLGGDVFDINQPLNIFNLLDAKVAHMTEHEKILNRIENVYAKAITDLTDARIEYLVADRYYLSQMSVTPDGRLLWKPFDFNAIVLPPMFILPLDVAEKIVAFAETGGYVYLLGQLPEGSSDNGMGDPKMKALMEKLEKMPSVRKAPDGIPQLVAEKAPFMKSQIEFESGEFPIIQLHRRIDKKDFFWLVNNTGSRQECSLTLSDVAGLASLWDCESGEITYIPSQSTSLGSSVKLAFKPYEAYWLVFDPKKQPMTGDESKPESWQTMATLDGFWNARIDTSVQPPQVAPRLIAPEPLLSKEGEKRPLTSWPKWGLDLFSGFVDYTATFQSGVDSGRIILDLGEVKHMAEVWINGKPVGYKLWPPFEFDIGDVVRKGQNEIKIRVGNLLCNAIKQYEGDKDSKNIWGWIKLVKEDFNAGLFGPVTIKKEKI